MIEYVVAAIVVFMGLVVLWKARPALRKFVRITDALDSLPAFMDRTDKDVKRLKQAVLPNHGTAIPDSLGRLERDISTVLTRLDNVEKWVEAESEDADEEHAAIAERIDLLQQSNVPDAD